MLENLIENSNNLSYQIGQLKSVSQMVYNTVDEKHINPSLRKRIKELKQ